MDLLYGEMEELLELLYQENEEKAYDQLIAILPKLESQIGNISSEENRNQAMEGLMLAMQAMKAEDMTLLADYLRYEVLERLMEA